MSTATTAAPTMPRHRVAFPFWHEAVLAALLAGLLLYARGTAPEFVVFATQKELLSHIWELAILAVPMTLIIITGGIDLSIGSTMALCAVVLGLSYEAGVPPFIGALLALLTGVAAGALNGIFVARVHVHPLIVTLATLAAYRGIAEGISLARPISGFPESFSRLSVAPIPGLLLALAAVTAAVVL